MTAEAWGPLTGRRILVTRRPEQSASLTGPLRALGATVLELPLIEIRPPLDCGPLDRALSRLSEYDWLVFTSSNAVEAVAERRAVLGLVGALPKVAVVGPATRDALALAFGGVTPDLEPVQEHRAEGLLHAFASWDLSGRKVLLPLSARARDTLASGLGHRGALVDTVIAYRTEQPQGLGEELRTLLDRGLDLVVLASPSAKFLKLMSYMSRRRSYSSASIDGSVSGSGASTTGFAPMGAMLRSLFSISGMALTKPPGLGLSRAAGPNGASHRGLKAGF